MTTNGLTGFFSGAYDVLHQAIINVFDRVDAERPGVIDVGTGFEAPYLHALLEHKSARIVGVDQDARAFAAGSRWSQLEATKSHGFVVANFNADDTPEALNKTLNKTGRKRADVIVLNAVLHELHQGERPDANTDAYLRWLFQRLRELLPKDGRSGHIIVGDYYFPRRLRRREMDLAVRLQEERTRGPAFEHGHADPPEAFIVPDRVLAAARERGLEVISGEDHAFHLAPAEFFASEEGQLFLQREKATPDDLRYLVKNYYVYTLVPAHPPRPYTQRPDVSWLENAQLDIDDAFYKECRGGGAGTLAIQLENQPPDASPANLLKSLARFLWQMDEAFYSRLARAIAAYVRDWTAAYRQKTPETLAVWVSYDSIIASIPGHGAKRLDVPSSLDIPEDEAEYDEQDRRGYWFRLSADATGLPETIRGISGSEELDYSSLAYNAFLHPRGFVVGSETFTTPSLHTWVVNQSLIGAASPPIRSVTVTTALTLEDEIRDELIANATRSRHAYIRLERDVGTWAEKMVRGLRRAQSGQSVGWPNLGNGNELFTGIYTAFLEATFHKNATGESYRPYASSLPAGFVETLDRELRRVVSETQNLRGARPRTMSTLSVVHPAGGQPIGSVMLFSDVLLHSDLLEALGNVVHGVMADVREAESDFIARRAEAFDEARTQVMAAIKSTTHDLITPVNTIVTHAQFLRDVAGDQLSPQQAGMLDKIVKSGMSLGENLRSVLLEGALDRQPIPTEPVKLDGLIGDVVAMVEPEIRAKNINWHSDEIPALYVMVSRTYAERVVLNLFTNAIKFSSPGDPVRILFHLSDHSVDVIVEDEGDGIPVEKQGELFQEGKRAGSTRHGHGYGLHFSRTMVRRMGGDLQLLRSEPGRGSQFVVTFARAVTER